MNSSDGAPAAPERRREGGPKPWAKAALAVLVSAVLIAGAFQITRAGYSVDEEFTVFAVRGIQQHGLPILPSGLLYDRGVAYSYAAFIAHAITGSELPVYRALSLLCAALTVLLTYVLVRRTVNNVAALSAAVLVTTSVPFWATATSGRFYAPFLVTWLLLLVLFTHRRMWVSIVLCAAASRLTHELAFLAALVPLAVAVMRSEDERRHWLSITVAVIIGLVMGQAILFLLHYAAPTSGSTMVQRFFVWQVLNLFERPQGRQFGVPLVAMVIGWLIAPRSARTVTVIGLAFTALIASFLLSQATNTAPMSIALLKSVIDEGTRYPLDMFRRILQLTPLTTIVALVCIAIRAFGGTEHWPLRERMAHLMWIAWVLWFGVIDSGITTNYLLLPITFILIAIAVDLVAINIAPRAPARRLFSDPSRAAWAGMVLLALLLAHDQWRNLSMDSARPTIVAAGIEEIRAGLQPTDRIACTDEIGCLMLVGRIDRWLALDPYVRDRFIVERANGVPSGVYTGVPAASRPAELFGPNPDGILPDRVIVVDIFKDYPIGNSRSWLPRAIEEDGLRVTPLLETPQMRVLQISAQEQVALRQPLP